MSYRNDHAAAVARVDALQLELTRLAAENETLRASPLVATPKPSRALGVLALGGAALAVGAAVMLGIAAGAGGVPHKAPPPAPSPEIVEVAAMTLSDLRTCELTLGPHPILDLRTPDIEAIDRTEAPCRLRLREAARSTALTDSRRIGILAWAEAEDQLANRISLIHEYYGTQAAVRENFASATQLLGEYNLALAARDGLLPFAFDGS